MLLVHIKTTNKHVRLGLINDVNDKDWKHGSVTVSLIYVPQTIL